MNRLSVWDKGEKIVRGKGGEPVDKPLGLPLAVHQILMQAPIGQNTDGG